MRQSTNKACVLGYSQVLSSGVRVIGPGGASILYAVSISKHILGGYLIWIVTSATAVLGFISAIIIGDSPRAI